ncbi:MAG: hypothetical protein ABSC06_39845 [Rhodopila sp.]|jgi:hypothetical protein
MFRHGPQVEQPALFELRDDSRPRDLARRAFAREVETAPDSFIASMP